MVQNFQSFNESKSKEEFQGYRFSVYRGEEPDGIITTFNKLRAIEGVEVINISDSETFTAITVIMDRDNEYLRAYVFDTLYNLDKLAIHHMKYTKEDIEYFKKYYSNDN